MVKNMKKPFLLLFILLLTFPAYAEEAAIEAKVIVMFDAEGFTALAKDGKLIAVKLYGIRCPTLKQPFGQQAVQATTNAVFNKQVQMTKIGTDLIGNTLAVVKYDDRVLQETLLGAGMAWVNRSDCNIVPCYRWITLEGNAKARKVGLWGDDNPVPPWERP